jgi:alpha-aminoadipic semialdehyde synthase
MIFPHVIKGQPANMDTLDVMVEKNIRLIDYERIVDENNNRLIAFGFFAGVAGAIDFLHGLGQYFLLQGITNSF